MTTFAYHVTLNDREVIALRNALSWYIGVCNGEILDDPKAHHSPHVQAISAIMGRLEENTTMMSSNSFFNRGNE